MCSLWRYISVLMILMMSSQWIVAEERLEFPFKSEILKGYEDEAVKARCDETDLQPIEGVWYYPEERMSFVIERCENPMDKNTHDYRVVLVESEDMSLFPGTVIGYCVETVDSNKFKLWLYSEQSGAVLENLQMCVATLNADSDELHIERSELKVKVRVNFSRFLPRLLRGVSISPSKKEVKAPEGFKKIYPKIIKNKVRYL